MAEVKPLKLRVERAAIKRSLVQVDPYVEVLVRTPFLQSQEVYTYGLPIGAEGAKVGALVSIPFGNQLVEGVILSRAPEPQVSGTIKLIHELISNRVVFTPEQIALARSLAERYACETWSFLTSTSPAFSKEGEKRSLLGRAETISPDSSERILPKALLKHLRSKEIARDLLVLPSQADSYELLVAIAHIRSQGAKAVIVLPDMKDLEACAQILDAQNVRYLTMHSGQKKSERFANYLAANSLESGIVLTLRNGCLLHLGPDDSLMIFNEAESHHYEQRSPTWNSRDIALVRSSQKSVLFVSHSPSVELVRQVEERWLSLFTFPSKKIRSTTFLSENEDSIFPIIEKGLRDGNVLISVARAGWINGFSCKGCKNPALCQCGGKLYFIDSKSAPLCKICSTRFLDWHCRWCNGVQIWSTSRGAVRQAAEFGRAFPRAKVIASSGDDQLQRVDGGQTIVIATLGSEPLGRYAAILILDAENAFAQVDLRSQEEVRLQWFKVISQLMEGGILYLSMPANSVVAQGVLRGDPFELARRESEERFSAKLPPFYRTLVIEAPFADLQAIIVLVGEKGFEATLLEGTQKKSAKLLIKFEVTQGSQCAALMSSIQRIRASKKQSYLGLKFDSYSIS